MKQIKKASTNSARKTGFSHAKVNSKWITDFHVRIISVRQIEENTNKTVLTLMTSEFSSIRLPHKENKNRTQQIESNQKVYSLKNN